MWFWWFTMGCNLIIPIILIIAGRMMWKHCPQKINAIYGYRTTRSMKNMDTWKFAHDFCGRLWWKIGWISLIPSGVILIPFYNKSEDTIGIVGTVICMLQLAALIISIFPTESALKRSFNDDGTRR